MKKRTDAPGSGAPGETQAKPEPLSRRSMLGLTAAGTANMLLGQTARAPKPNIIVILADDLGFADLSLTGNPVIRTPNIDQMAREGLELTSFYAAPVCTPSRGMLLTSRYPPRTGLLTPTGPESPAGIRAGEHTLPEALKKQGYRTAMFGKWHLGDFDTDPKFNPTAHGFDTFLGLPYSHDYNPPEGVPLYRDLKKVEQPVAYQTLTQRYTDEAVKFIHDSAHQPFFLYLAHNMPHIPIGTSDRFKGHSRAGRYGDVIEEVDWGVGEVLRTVRQLGLERKTIVVFTSDNGPWASVGEQLYDRKERGQKVAGDVGWAGLFRGSKASTWEGGIRVPAIFHWPGVIPAARSSADMASIMDLFPTFVNLAGGTLPTDRPLDGIDMLPMLKGGSSPRKEFFYFLNTNMQAIRQGPWKLRVAPPDPSPVASGGSGAGVPPANLTPELYNLDTDPSERFNVAADHPDLVDQLRKRMQTFDAELHATAVPASGYIERVSPRD